MTTDYSAWVGREQSSTDVICPRVTRWMAAAMNRIDLFDALAPTTPDGAVDPLEDRLAHGQRALPYGWHWLFFNPLAPQSRLGVDGHPERGGFLPPVPQPRRMWAGSRLHWHAPFRIGATVSKHSHIVRIEQKPGRNGDMVFVTVRYQYRDGPLLLLEEEHDTVYRADSTAEERAALSADAAGAATFVDAFERRGAMIQRIVPDPVLLFRYSAATFNGHRIHYDLPYARDVEGYPGLVVHGPLIATMLLGFIEQTVSPGQAIASFTYRAKRPTFDISPFHLHADAPDEQGATRLWSTNNTGAVGVDGTLVLSGARA